MKLFVFFFLCLFALVNTQDKPSAEDVEKTAKDTKEQYDKAAEDTDRAMKTYEEAAKEAGDARKKANELKAAGGDAYEKAKQAAEKAEEKSKEAKAAAEAASQKADDLKSKFDRFRGTLGPKAEEIWNGHKYVSGSTISSFIGSVIIVFLARFI
ncbi:unnamed protein product [Caenorhabditis angaria]|uniref:Uncharacterized protein n=1 Tax=Caenorhabditis angaria TaxID=860376 RepID=A0A9P1N334_9PELO|nr:unnamed protein product [Caenorhabditis angaria]